ncbi:unnamed protein product [Sympodiomycopsis kandeliae]
MTSSSEKQLYEPFISNGFQRRQVDIPPSENDPELELSLHVLVKRPSVTPQSATTIVLLHGHPQSNLIWHRVIPLLKSTLDQWDSLRILIPDLRGHGQSGIPRIERNEKGEYKNSIMRQRYSKRAMARDIVQVCQKCNVRDDEKIFIVAHDRGARVAHRLALDYPEKVEKMILLDIAPTLNMYTSADHRFASDYWHWFFLIQPWPFPENFILGNPKAYLDKMTSRPNSGTDTTDLHPKHIKDSYLSTLSDPLNVEATCEDYRASNPIDGIDIIVHDIESSEKGIKINCPIRVLWGSKGVIQAVYGKDQALAFWRKACQQDNLLDRKSRAVQSGHYIPEENPTQVVQDLIDFFSL